MEAFDVRVRDQVRRPADRPNGVELRNFVVALKNSLVRVKFDENTAEHTRRRD